MKAQFHLAIYISVWVQIFGQYANGQQWYIPMNEVISGPPPAAANNNNNNCQCLPAGNCPTPPSIDIRIVNNGGAPCPPGYVWCCNPPAAPPAPPPQPTNPPPDPGCGVRKIAPTSQPVVGQASFGAYPWQVALMSPQQTYFASGVLLDATHVLTAAHVIGQYVNNPSSLLVRMGEWNTLSTTEPYQFVQMAAAKITVHPNFNPINLENDVAVIKLSGAVSIPSYPNINTACKPTGPPAPGTRCYVSGWGANLFGPNGAYQSIMREVDVPIVEPTDCENRLRATRLGPAYVLNKMSFLCAGGEVGKDACTGDGGSPLVCTNPSGQWYVAGLVAWGIGCASPNVPGVYTNVFNFLPWINTALMT